MIKQKKIPDIIKRRIVSGFEDYFIWSNGKVFKGSREITPHKCNRSDRQLSVFLFRNGKKKAVPLRYIVLNAFYGIREKKCYKSEFLDGDTYNCSAKNLRWVLRKNISFFDILTDQEFRIYNEAVKEIKDINIIRKNHEQWMQKFICWMKKNQTASADLRYEFFINLFK